MAVRGVICGSYCVSEMLIFGRGFILFYPSLFERESDVFSVHHTQFELCGPPSSWMNRDR